MRHFGDSTSSAEILDHFSILSILILMHMHKAGLQEKEYGTMPEEGITRVYHK